MTRGLGFILFVPAIMIVAACNHGYEGQYKVVMEYWSEHDGEWYDWSKVPVEDKEVLSLSRRHIGSNYIDYSDGKREKFKDIFIRQSFGRRYLVLLEKSGKEQVWRIDKNDRLIIYEVKNDERLVWLPE